MVVMLMKVNVVVSLVSVNIIVFDVVAVYVAVAVKAAVEVEAAAVVAAVGWVIVVGMMLSNDYLSRRRNKHKGEAEEAECAAADERAKRDGQ